MIGLRRRRCVVENVTYFDSDDELEKKNVNIDIIKTCIAKINIDIIKTCIAKLNIDKDSIKTYAQILIEILLMDLPIPHMRIESIAMRVVNMICD